MKKVLAIAVILSLLSCSDDPVSAALNYEEIAGIWVPFEIKYSDGSVNNGPFTASSIFGVYAESVKLNADKTYYPVIWFDESDYIIKTDEIGDFELLLNNKHLFLTSGLWDLEFKVMKLTQTELWVSMEDTEYKLRRELQY